MKNGWRNQRNTNSLSKTKPNFFKKCSDIFRNIGRRNEFFPQGSSFQLSSKLTIITILALAKFEPLRLYLASNQSREPNFSAIDRHISTQSDVFMLTQVHLILLTRKVVQFPFSFNEASGPQFLTTPRARMLSATPSCSLQVLFERLRLSEQILT